MAKWQKGQSGNAAGRPKGSRNKIAIVKAQHTVDSAMPETVKMLCAIAFRDEAGLLEYDLTPKDVSVKQMLDAAKQLKDMGWVKNVVLDGDKAPDKKPEQNQSSKPTFSPVASIKQKSA